MSNSTADPEDLDWVFGETVLENIARRIAERPARRAARAVRALLELRIASATDLEVTAAITIQQVCSVWLERQSSDRRAAEEAHNLILRFDFDCRAFAESWPTADSYTDTE